MQVKITDNFNTGPQNKKITSTGNGTYASIYVGRYFCRKIIMTMDFSITQEPNFIFYTLATATLITLDEPALSNGQMARLQNLNIAKTSWSFEHVTGVLLDEIIIQWTDILTFNIDILLIGL